jgi:hypothetical protein
VIRKGTESFFPEGDENTWVGLSLFWCFCIGRAEQAGSMATFEMFVRIFVFCLTAYAALGLLFASLFVFRGVHQVDPETQGSGLGFRLLILPGVAAFWPMFLRRWIRGIQPPIERNPHR